MNLTDATIALLLAAKIHGTDAAVKVTAKRCAQRLPRSKRAAMYSVMDSRETMKCIAHLTKFLD